MSLLPGDMLAGYRIVAPLGEGGMARVYKAFQPSLERHVAVKVLSAQVALDAGFQARFRREAQTVAALRHPNVLVIYDWGELQGQAYLVTELVEGGTLASRLGMPLPPAECLAVVRAIASALDYAHARGVVHRDVKPSNVLLHRDGTPVLADFGVAQMLDGSPRLTAVGVLVGTPQYMAPECLDGDGAAPSVDLYALGVILYEMLTGSVPYRADTPGAVLLAHHDGPLPLPRERNPELSPALEAVLLRALARDPGDRYPTGAELVAALERACADRSPTPSGAPPATLPLAASAPERPGRRGPPRAAGALAAGAVFTMAAAWTLAHLIRVAPVHIAAPQPPAHGTVAFQLGLRQAAANEVAFRGTVPGDGLRFLGRAVQFTAAEPASGSGVAPFLGLPRITMGDFVLDTGLQFVSGAGAVGLGLHGTSAGEDVILLSTTGQLAIDRLHAITAAQPSSKPVVLYGPAPLPAGLRVAGAVDVAVAASGAQIRVYVDGVSAATASDPSLTLGWFDVRAEPFPGGRLVFRLTRWVLYRPPAT